MKKAVIVGGSNGIGLAISRELMDKGYYLEICDRVEPEEGILDPACLHYSYCDLTDFDEDVFLPLAGDKDVDLLMITAGIGRVADFKAHHIAEIDKILTIDTLSTIKLFRIFYDRILSNDTFYAGVMGSISGWMSSPATSVYAAAKAGLVRFVESVNIELEVAGTDNRILDVSPSFFDGSRFYGGKNALSVTGPLAVQIVEHLFNRDTRFIPRYEETFKAVLERYHKNSHEYGLHSYQYKKDSGRLDNDKKVKIRYLSAAFDLFHIEYLNLLRRARQCCDYLIVGVIDSDKGKGKENFIPLGERKELLAACKYVDKVVDACPEDSDAWDLWHYDRLFVSFDHKDIDRFSHYQDYFEDKGVEVIYFPYALEADGRQIRKDPVNGN